MNRYYDPCIGSRMVKWRWRIAGWLNRLPRTCWANIVSWALGSRPMFDSSGNEDDIRRTSACFQLGDERCYCGKYANPLDGGPSS
jgi:hypothetical protein